MTRQLVGKVNSLVSSPLRYHDNTTDLLHLGIIRWAGAVQVACDLKDGAQFVSSYLTEQKP